MIKDYKSFMVKEQEDDLLADLSDLGFERKYSEDMISDAMSYLDIEEYVTHIDNSSYTWKISGEYGNSNERVSVTMDCWVDFTTTLNADNLWDDLEKNLEKLDLRDYEERNWTISEVKDAFFDVDWDIEAHEETSIDHIEGFIKKPTDYREGNEIELDGELDSSPKFNMTSKKAANLVIKNLP